MYACVSLLALRKPDVVTIYYEPTVQPVGLLARFIHIYPLRPYVRRGIIETRTPVDEMVKRGSGSRDYFEG